MSNPLPIAIKRSRVSQRIPRPRLWHEAQLLHALFKEGHPSIPRVIAYGHLRHFEFSAMELLGKSLQELTPQNGMSEPIVAKIAIQLVRRLTLSYYTHLLHA